MYTVHSETSIEVYKMLSRVVSLGPNKVEISCKDFFPPDVGLFIGSFTYASSLVYKNWSLTEVFLIQRIHKVLHQIFFGGRGLQTQEGSPLNAFATFKANTQIFTCMASLMIGNKVTVALRGFFHNCWGFLPVGLSDVQWGKHTVWSTVSQGIKKISSSDLNYLGMRRGEHC